MEQWQVYYGIALIALAIILFWIYQRRNTRWQARQRVSRSAKPQRPKQPEPNYQNIGKINVDKIHAVISELEKLADVGQSFPSSYLSVDDGLSGALLRLESLKAKMRAETWPNPIPTKSPPEEITYSLSTPEPGSSLGEFRFSEPPPFAEEFVDSFNLAMGDRSARNVFWDRFTTDQIGNRNATEQRMGRSSVSDFRTGSPGDFIAVADELPNRYLVAPNFNTIVDETSYKYGGIAEAFEADMASGASYQRFRLVKPAVFSRDGEKWHVVDRGRLDLSI